MTFESLRNSISSEKDEETRIAVILDLGENKAEISRDLLMDKLSTLNSFVRDAIVISLVKIGDVEFLCSNLGHEHRYVRRGIVQALGQLGGIKACEVLVSCLDDEEWGVRMYSAEALGKVGSNKHIKLLKNLLNDEHEWPRKEAQKSIKKLSSFGK